MFLFFLILLMHLCENQPEIRPDVKCYATWVWGCFGPGKNEATRGNMSPKSDISLRRRTFCDVTKGGPEVKKLFVSTWHRGPTEAHRGSPRFTEIRAPSWLKIIKLAYIDLFFVDLCVFVEKTCKIIIVDLILMKTAILHHFVSLFVSSRDFLQTHILALR